MHVLIQHILFYTMLEHLEMKTRSYPTRACYNPSRLEPARPVLSLYNMDQKKKKVRRSFGIPNKIIYGLVAAFMVATLVTAYLTYRLVRGVMASLWEPASPQISVEDKSAGTPAPNIDPRELNKPLQAKGGPPPQNWNQDKRVNVLVMGLDYRDWEAGNDAARTDTMILFTIDPTTRSAGMISIPRDLWVKIPGFEYGKINTAYFLGQAYKVTGGGPALAMQTVEQLLDVNINFYAQIDFYAFEKFIDEIGGIDFNVTEEISVDPLGPHNTVLLEAGLQHLDGATALAYARSRNTAGSDFDRADRQQKVIMAIRKRILDFNMLPILIEKSPILYKQLKGGVHTNLTLEQVIALAWLASQVPQNNIQKGVIGPDQVTNDVSYDGQYILVPDITAIRMLRDEVFTPDNPAAVKVEEIDTGKTPTPRPAATATGDPAQLFKAEKARVSVLNGTYTSGLASETTQYLKSKGINVAVTDNAPDVYEQTTIIDYTGKLYTRLYLAQLLNVSLNQIYSQYDPNSPVDIAVFLGDDWATNNPLP